MTAGGQSDIQLVARAVTGDRAAFSALARNYGPHLAALLRAYGVPAGEVEDIAQEGLIAAWRSLGEFDQNQPFRAWLFQITLNKGRDWRRRRRVRAFFFGASALDDGEAERIAGGEPTPEARVENRDMLRRIDRLVADLPGSLKDAFLLTTVSGLTHAEAGEVLGLTAKAVERRVDRARSALQPGLRRLAEQK